MSLRKFLIIGSEDFNLQEEGFRITSVSWQALEQMKNIKDYDNLIINLTEFQNVYISDNIDYKVYKKFLNFENINKILFNRGQIVLLGDPRFLIKTEDGSVEHFLKWSGFNFLWDNNDGDTLQIGNHYLIDYISKIKKWEYSLEGCSVNKSELGNVYNLKFFEEKDIQTKVEKIDYALNRYNNSIVFSLRHKFVTKEYGKDLIVKESGSILFLPMSSLSVEDSIYYIFENYFNIKLIETPPKWLMALKVPREIILENKLEANREEIKMFVQEQKNILKQISELRECTKLLYESDVALEAIVLSTLSKLNAEIEEPEEKGFEDGWIKIEIDGQEFEGVLEIKSTTKENFDEKGRKQVLDWVSRGITNRLKTYKGIFVGNNLYKEHPSKRPLGFSDNWKKAAELGKICAIKTEHIYLVYYLNEMKLVNLTEFWKDVFNTNGIFNISKYETIAKEKGLNIFPEPSEK